MGFYNMRIGDAPYTKQLADNFAMSDNYHQPAMGGTGLDSIMLFFGDALWFQDQNGNLVPPHNQNTFAGGPVDGSKIPTLNPERITGGPRTATAGSGTMVDPRAFTAAEPIATAQIYHSPALDRLWHIWVH